MPAATLMTVGKNTPKARVTILDPSPMPNQMMNSGTRAIFGMGKKADTTAMPGARAQELRPTANPAATPQTVPGRPADGEAAEGGGQVAPELAAEGEGPERAGDGERRRQEARIDPAGHRAGLP